MAKFKRFLVQGLAAAGAFSVASVVLASDGADVANPIGLAKLGAAIAIAIGAGGAATAQGRAASAALEGIARNPTSRKDVFTPLLLSLAFMEVQALLCFLIALNLAS